MKNIDGQWEKPKGSLAIRLKEYHRKQTKKDRKAIRAQKRLAKLRSMSYTKYLQSSHWQKLRRYMRRRFSVCQNCGNDQNLQIHHKTYVRRGEEDPERDLVMLCGSCHGAHHKDDGATLIGSYDILSLRNGSAQAVETAKEVCTEVGREKRHRKSRRLRAALALRCANGQS